MEWAIALLVVAVLGVAAAIASGGVGGMSSDPVRDQYRQDLPDAALTAGDLQTLRFGVCLRGYAMDQVDDLLARLSHEIAERDALIAEFTPIAGVAEGRPVAEGTGIAGGGPVADSKVMGSEPAVESLGVGSSQTMGRSGAGEVTR